MLFLVFIFGAVLGSFLNVVLLRKNTGESFIYGDSRCFSCNQKLKWYEMIPILSFALLRARCGHCGSRISWQYALVELLTGFMALSIYSKFYAFKPTVFYFAAFSSLFLIALYDFRNKIIDSHFLYIFGFLGVYEWISRWLWGGGFIFKDLLSSFFIAFFFYLLWRLSRGTWMGRGDSNLAIFLGLFLGFPQNIFMLVLAFWIGAIVGITLLLMGNGRFNIKSEIPFGPFLALATFIVWDFSTFFNGIYHVYFF